MAGQTLLIVEDNPINLELTRDVLEIAGFNIFSATTAEEGIAIARAKQPDLILMDIGLPGMSGLEATAILKQDSSTKDIPIIGLTAHAMTGDKEKALASGLDGYITKPIDTRRLAAQVDRYLT